MTTVKRSTTHDKVSVYIRFDNGDDINFSAVRSGIRGSVSPSIAKKLSAPELKALILSINKSLEAPGSDLGSKFDALADKARACEDLEAFRSAI